MHKMNHRGWRWAFGAVALLILAQVAWWTNVFMDSVSTIETLRKELAVSADSASPATNEEIEREADRRRLMFWSESGFFVFLTCLAVYLLYRALSVEERSRQTQKNFIEIISHESKTPLTALKLRLESLRESADAGTQIEISAALDEVRRLTSLFDKAMNLNRMERKELSFENIDVSEVVEAVAKRIDPLLKARHITLQTSIEGRAIVRGDTHGLQNSIQSLLENAILHNSRGEGKIALRVERQPSKVHIDIDDNGPGIAEKDQPHIFERFYRGRSGRQSPGTGLGLFIAKFIVEAHAGSIRLAPSRFGGARFLIELPAGEA